ncbi:pantothenate transporter, partial [Aspergillus heteromorphus CBS 117.55]
MTGQIHRVAVIGAGVSGVVSAAHLLAHGIDVTVFERNHAAGGVWLHDARRPLEPHYPSMKPSISERHRDEVDGKEGLELEHAPPGPCYDGLRNNVPTSLMRVKLNAWPEGTPEFVSHRVMKEYIQDTSAKAGSDAVTIYGARVTKLHKDEGNWRLTWSTLEKSEESGALEEQEQTASFDAVVVASGHYHAPRVPNIAGLTEAKAQWPSRVTHSKGYRKPDGFKDKTVLLIGGGVSSTDIAREIGPLAKTVYQSTRNGEFDISADVLPENGVRVGEIERFEIKGQATPDEALPITAHLKSGQKLCEIDAIIICTGYHISLPFLPEYHDDATPADKASETILVTDGTQVHNLHKDIFYIPDPTLAFVGVPYYTATFTLFEFQAIAVANAFAGIAALPPTSEMKSEYARRIAEKGSGKRFHSLKDIEEFYVIDLLAWVNAFRVQHGLPPIEGHSDSWHQGKAAHRERIKTVLTGAAEASSRRDSGVGGLPVLAICLDFNAMAPSPAVTDERDGIIQKAPKQRWVSYLWDTFDKPPEERRLLFKLDSAILTFASLGYFIKYLDQINVNNAFVSGMKEDLGLYGNQLNYMQACWTVGYVIGEIPSNILLTRVRPRYWIPAMELLWTVLTFILSQATSAKHFYVLRFFIGLAESTFYPGMQYIIGSWYRRDELAKRSCLFHTSSGVASMFSGYLMAGVFTLGGVGGLKGWQWLFLIDGIISVPVAIAGFFVLPDVPEISDPWYLSKEEIKLAQKRMELEGRKNREPYTKAKLKKIFSSWRIYLLTIVYIAFNNGAAGSQPVFQQYLKDSTHPTYTIDQINAYPTTTNAVQVVTTLIYAWTSDTILGGRRWPCIIFGACINIICYVSLAIWNIPVGWKWTCYILSGAGYGLSGLCMAWAHEICASDNEERALVIGSMNEMAYVFQAWLPLIVWQQVDGPQYRKGFITVTIMSVILIVSTEVTRRFQAWE